MRWWVLRRGAPLAVLALGAMFFALACSVDPSRSSGDVLTRVLDVAWGASIAVHRAGGASALSTEVVALATESMKNMFVFFAVFELFMKCMVFTRKSSKLH